MVQVDVKLSAEQMAAEPDFEKTLARFQRQYDNLAGDMREKFRLCLHEAGHIVFNRRLGWETAQFHGPYAYRNDEGELCLDAAVETVQDQGTG